MKDANLEKVCKPSEPKIFSRPFFGRRGVLNQGFGFVALKGCFFIKSQTALF